MAQLGSIQTIVVCVPATEQAELQPRVCPAVGGQSMTPATLQAYLIDPAQQNNLEAAVGPFDYQYAASIWSLAFSMVVGLYFVSVSIGSVLGMIRRG
jgi:hypothetical protein